MIRQWWRAVEIDDGIAAGVQGEVRFECCCCCCWDAEGLEGGVGVGGVGCVVHANAGGVDAVEGGMAGIEGDVVSVCVVCRGWACDGGFGGGGVGFIMVWSVNSVDGGVGDGVGKGGEGGDDEGAYE